MNDLLHSHQLRMWQSHFAKRTALSASSCSSSFHRCSCLERTVHHRCCDCALDWMFHDAHVTLFRSSIRASQESLQRHLSSQKRHRLSIEWPSWLWFASKRHSRHRHGHQCYQRTIFSQLWLLCFYSIDQMIHCWGLDHLWDRHTSVFLLWQLRYLSD